MTIDRHLALKTWCEGDCCWLRVFSCTCKQAWFWPILWSTGLLFKAFESKASCQCDFCWRWAWSMLYFSLNKLGGIISVLKRAWLQLSHRTVLCCTVSLSIATCHPLPQVPASSSPIHLEWTQHLCNQRMFGSMPFWVSIIGSSLSLPNILENNRSNNRELFFLQREAYSKENEN